MKNLGDFYLASYISTFMHKNADSCDVFMYSSNDYNLGM